MLGVARYGRDGKLDAPALDAALENGTSALEKLRGANAVADAHDRLALEIGG